MSEQIANVPWPVIDGTRVPYEIYTSQAVFDRERERIYQGPLWHYVGLEAEIPNPGDFRTSFVGDMPVVVSRDQDGGLAVFLNRCAHRGAIVQRHASGNTKEHRCVYHQWCYDGRGDLVSVPYRRGGTSFGGYAADFDMKRHGLRKLRASSYKGVIFATFDAAAPTLEAFLEPPLLAAIDRLFSRKVKVLGHMRQRIRGNWKLYIENTRDPYHAALLHGFHATFGTWRSNQKGFRGQDEARAHSAGGKYGNDFAKPPTAERVGQDNFIASYALSDLTLMQGRPDFDDDINLAITSIFPSVIVQQIMNTLATRHVRPKAPNDFELYWTYFGYEDDDEETLAARLKQANLIGPAGLISMEDGEAVELIQRAIEADDQDAAFVEFGPFNPDLENDRQGEDAVRAFWRYYRKVMA